MTVSTYTVITLELSRKTSAGGAVGGVAMVQLFFKGSVR